ncbi:MAG TPA: DegV family EDD domain-containing protein [Acidobacteria bacterium]|nr:DegV family EDD domain-containing protein [Acidobacteriota bacterium]
MPETPTILVADSLDERRRTLGLGLYEGGYEVINAVNAEEAIRFTAGLNPTLVLVHTGLEGAEPLELHQRLAATGLELPPFLVLHDGDIEIGDDIPESGMYFLSSVDLTSARLLQQVRLLLLSRELGGDLAERIDVLYSDLTRVSIGDLLSVLQKHVITGVIRLAVSPEAGIWVRDGLVMDAYWGAVRGRKAFNRIASLRGGAFTIDLEAPPEERNIDTDLATLVSDAVEERFQLDELFRDLPPLNSRVELEMGDQFFSLEFTETEREILTQVQKVRNFSELIDVVPHVDLEVVKAVADLRAQGILKLVEPKQKLHVVTDSTADILPVQARRLGITVVPLSVLFGSQVFKDGIDLQPDQFYKRLVESQRLPTTSPPSIGEFKEAYGKLIGDGDIISLHISTVLSDTAKRAQDAVKQGAETFQQLREASGLTGLPVIRVVDSWQTTVGLGMMVQLLVRMVERGLGADEIVRRLEDQKKRFHLIFSVDTLEYLKKGGRIGRAQAMIGTLLGIKPILSLHEGEVTPIDRVRGGRNVIPKLISILKGRVKVDRPVFVGIGHASAPRWAGKLREAIVENFKVIEVYESQIGPIVGTHVGPGTVGASFFQPTEEELELLRPLD